VKGDWLKEGHSITMASSQSFTTFEPSHLDVVLAVDFNYYGTRMATASADHRVKVYDRKDDSWNLVDTFGAHDAEITDVWPSHEKC
jgi:nucleoporin SEH1